MPALVGLPALAGLILAGCALGADPSPFAESSEAAVAPSVAALAPAIQETFRATKLPGAPRVSPIRQAPLTALGDWSVCLMSDSEADRRVYALFVHNTTIADWRLAIPLDGCTRESFMPLPNPLLTK